jgi:DnaJ-class molecular chaperone
VFALSAWELEMSVGGRRIGFMMILELCVRCEGSGADPAQRDAADEVRLCIECDGDGYFRVVAEESLQLAS